MSTVFNYDAPGVARTYDRTRHTLGTDVVAGLLQVHSGKALKDLHVLDAGCGTGHFAQSLINIGIGKMTLLDASSEMLTVAKENLNDAITKNVVDAVVTAKLPKLPFAEETFDVVLFFNVLNHLELDCNGVDFPGMEKTLAQTKRILRKNGILVVMACSRSIINDAIWFSQIHPDITDKLSKINPSVKQYIALFSKHGFKCVSAMNLIPTTSIFDDRLNPEGPLNEDWRIGTSMFQLAGPEKEKEMVQFVLDMKDKGTLEQFVSDHDRTTEIGEMTLFVCISV